VKRQAAEAAELASRLQSVADGLGAGEESARPPSPTRLDDPLGLYDALIDHSELRQTTRKVFADQHYALAVEEAFKCLNNLVKRRSGNAIDDGAPLMNKTFSPTNPVLKLNTMKTVSQRDQQQGYMLMISGAMTGIRNPRAHEHAFPDEPRGALEMLALANHLMRMTDQAIRTRRRRKPQSP
jgi:uncharacterized protein (TIGR02391 family)